MGKDVIIACDFASREATFAFLDRFTGKKPFIRSAWSSTTPKAPRSSGI